MKTGISLIKKYQNSNFSIFYFVHVSKISKLYRFSQYFARKDFHHKSCAQTPKKQTLELLYLQAMEVCQATWAWATKAWVLKVWVPKA